MTLGISASFTGTIERTTARRTRAGFGVFAAVVKPSYRVGQPRASIRCSLWTDDPGRLGDLLPVGARVHVEGSLALPQWFDPDGIPHASLTCDGCTVQVLDDAGNPPLELRQAGIAVEIVAIGPPEPVKSPANAPAELREEVSI